MLYGSYSLDIYSDVGFRIFTHDHALGCEARTRNMVDLFDN